MSEKEKYDMYISLGPDCRPAMHLKIHNLRTLASPLDYQMSYSLDTVLKLFQTGFEDFFVEIKEDLELSRTIEKRWIVDIKNNIISIHHFDKVVGGACCAN